MPLILFIPLAIIQLTIIPLLAIGAIVPNLLVILSVLFSLYYGQFYGTLFAALIGLIFDLISGGIIGSTMFAITISGFTAGYFHNENKIESNTSTLLLLAIVFLASSLFSFFYLLLTSSEIKLTASYLFLEQGILPGLYTALFALPVVIFNQRHSFL